MANETRGAKCESTAGATLSTDGCVVCDGPQASCEAANDACGWALEFRDVSFSYSRGEFMRRLNLKVPAGGVIGIVGPNGCGKSTLLKLACALERPARGDVFVAGSNVAGLRARERAAKVAYLPQDLFASSMDVRELVSCGRYARVGRCCGFSREDEAAVNEALSRCGLGFLEGSPVAMLSGGQRQRAYLAMVLAQQAQLMLLDEPTSALDVGAAHRVMACVRSVATSAGSTAVAVIHDLDLALCHCDWLVVMDNARVVFQGSPEQVAASRELAEAFGIRVSRHSDGLGASYTFRPV